MPDSAINTYDPDNMGMSPVRNPHNMIPMTSVKKPKILAPTYYQVDQDTTFNSQRSRLDLSPRGIGGSGIVASPMIGQNKRSRTNNKRLAGHNTIEED